MLHLRPLGMILLLSMASGCAKKDCAIRHGAEHVPTTPARTSGVAPAASVAAEEQTEQTHKQAALDFALMEDGYLHDPNGQWSESGQYSSIRGYTPDNPVARNLLRGPPDNDSWESGSKDVGIDWVIAEFLQAVTATEVRLAFEMHRGAKAVASIELIADNGSFHSIWSGLNNAPEEERGPRTWVVRQFEPTPYKAKGVRIRFANVLDPGRVSLDAVQLVGH